MQVETRLWKYNEDIYSDQSSHLVGWDAAHSTMSQKL